MACGASVQITGTLGPSCWGSESGLGLKQHHRCTCWCFGRRRRPNGRWFCPIASAILVGLKKGCHTQKSCNAVGFGLGFGFAFRLGRDC